jgi:hypothetical protein
MDRISTVQFPCVGGLITNMDVLAQGREFPGSAIRLTNYEPAVGGGYARMLGYVKFDDDEVPGTGNILGSFVFEDMVIACRDDGVYTSTGSGWTEINGASPRTGADVYRGTSYDFMGEPRFVFVDGVNAPAYVDPTGTYTEITAAPAGAQFVAAFKGRLWFAVDNIVTYSAPLDDEDYLVASGAGEINVTHNVTGMSMFRDSLVIFGASSIVRITGNSAADFAVVPVSNNIGCTYPDTIIEANGDLFFLGPDGLRTFAATERNNDFNIGTISEKNQKNIRSLMTTYGRIVAYPVRAKSQIRLTGFDTDIPAVSTRGAIAVIQGESSWDFSETNGIKINSVHSDYTDTNTELIVFGNDDGLIYQLESGNLFGEETIQSVYQTPYLSLEDINIRKSFRKLQVYFSETASYSLDVGLKLDFDLSDVIQPPTQTLDYLTGTSSVYGSAVYGAATYGSVTTPYGSLMLVGAGKSGSFVFISSSNIPPHTIKSLSLEVSTYGRK